MSAAPAIANTFDIPDGLVSDLAKGSVKWDKDPESIKAARDKLFEDGSEFQPTDAREVVGIDNVLAEVDNIIHWLAHSDDYEAEEARLEPGVIFEGNPGTGKTLVSRYIATQSGAHFINVRDFAHAGTLYADADIRDLFARARAYYAQHGQPVLLFWDEFENAARERGNATPDQVATVSQLTAELDGINGKNKGVLLIACTNYIYGIDQALRRAGRMGLQVEFAAPNREGKRILLDHYLTKRAHVENIDTETLSFFFDSTATAADIEEAVMEAWTAAVRRTLFSNHTGASLSQEDLMTVFVKRLVGPPIANVSLSDEVRLRIAIHETGHALVAAISDVPLRLITVQPGKKSLGRVITAEMEDHVATTAEMLDHLRIALGSIIAERVTDTPSITGSTGDIQQANQLATRLVDRLDAGQTTGIFSVGSVVLSRCEDAGISQRALEASDIDIATLLDEAEKEVIRALNNVGPEAILAIAEVVNRNVTMTGAEFEQAVREVTGVEDLKSFA
jgi:cell division protease FtsH